MKKGSSIMLRLRKTPHEGRAKDGSVSTAEGLAAVGGVVGRRIAWAQSLAAVADSPGNGVRPRSEDRHDVVESRRNPRRLRRLLLLSPAPGTQVQRVGPAIVDAPVGTAGERSACAPRRGRYAHQAVWAAGARGRHSSQSHSRPGRPEVPVWPYLGDDRAGAAAPAVADDWFAALGVVVCAGQGHRPDSEEAWLAIPYQAGTGGRVAAELRRTGDRRGKNRLGGGRRGLRQASVSEAAVADGCDDRQPVAEGRGAADPSHSAEDSKTRPAAKVWDEADSFETSGRPSLGMAAGRMLRIRATGHQDDQDLFGDVPAGRRRNSGGDRPRASRLRILLLHRSPSHAPRDHRSVCGSSGYRTGLSRREGSLGHRAAASSQYLDERGRVQPEPVGAYAGGMLGLAQAGGRTLQPQPVALGQPRPPPLPRGPSQDLAPPDPAKRILVALHRASPLLKNPHPLRTPTPTRGLTTMSSQKVQLAHQDCLNSTLPQVDYRR